MDKTELLKLKTNYLGHVITREGIKTNPDNISAVEKCPIPETTIN